MFYQGSKGVMGMEKQKLNSHVRAYIIAKYFNPRLRYGI